MKATLPSREDLVDAIADATRAAVATLFREHPDHHFYYCALITTGEALSPSLTAWSWEALDTAAKERDMDPAARTELKWSYADSPFYCYNEERFDRVRKLFDVFEERELSERARAAARELRMRAMVEAMKRLDKEGLFGWGRNRADIVVNVECMPPDYTNVERARELNPPEALTDWLAEAGEEPE